MLPRFDLCYQGMQGILASLCLIALCLSEVIFGWIGDALWVRIAYGLAALLLGVPMLSVSLAKIYLGISGDVRTNNLPRIFQRK
ncbi:hypothetical protein [Bremerella sp. P1]|uniref:hypothetical protein n=1 Tax=Bremerella sp. P1 TaxID=3026424 RepID=UPI0023675D0B|nr:hypothetical protein [Bremerella sp. P1]WDI44296.1 hypothetical protein PSR63_10175 [Bremerella sp. P1]